MNERIKELAFGANLITKKNNGADFRWGYMDPALEKKLEQFAEAIVRSCADMCHNEALVQSENGSLPATYQEKALDDMGVAIMHRFGLK